MKTPGGLTTTTRKRRREEQGGQGGGNARMGLTTIEQSQMALLFSFLLITYHILSAHPRRNPSLGTINLFNPNIGFHMCEATKSVLSRPNWEVPT